MVVRESLDLCNVFQRGSMRVSKFLAVHVATLDRQARLDVLRSRRAGAAKSAAENESHLYPLVGVRRSDNAGTG